MRARPFVWRVPPLILLIFIVFFDSHRFGVDGAACKGCTPPCICPGTKGETGLPGKFFVLNNANHFCLGFGGQRGHPGQVCAAFFVPRLIPRILAR
jgi:hypothetical protein